MTPEIHNIIARWNKEAGVQNTGIKINEVKDENVRRKEIIINIFTDKPGRLIGEAGSLMYKYKKEITDFYREYYPKSTVFLYIELTELNEMVGQEEIDVGKYCKALIDHVFENTFGDIF